MKNEIVLKDCNVVIIANTFNISIINTIWLFKNGIFSEEELQGATCLPVIVDIRTENFHLNLIPDRLQFSTNPNLKNAKELIINKIGKFIKTLPHKPFVACGLNFTYHIKPTNGDIYSLSRSLFCKEDSKIFEELNDKEVRFGGYFSKDLIGTRFRLDAKPVKIKSPESMEEVLQFSYNFNINISPGDDYKVINNLLEKWDEAQEITLNLTNKINL